MIRPGQRERCMIDGEPEGVEHLRGIGLADVHAIRERAGQEVVVLVVEIDENVVAVEGNVGDEAAALSAVEPVLGERRAICHDEHDVSRATWRARRLSRTDVIGIVARNEGPGNVELTRIVVVADDDAAGEHEGKSATEQYTS